MSKPNLASRAKRILNPEPATPVITHPFDVYRDPDAPAGPTDGVVYEEISAATANSRAGRLSDAQRAGIAAEIALLKQRQA